MTKNLPCPFCGSTNLFKHYYLIVCENCGAEVPFHIWNKRHHIEKANEVLNKELDNNIELMHDLFLQKVECDKEIADNSSFYIRKENDKYYITIMGIINGILHMEGEDKGQLYTAYRDWDEEDEIIEYFGVTNKS